MFTSCSGHYFTGNFGSSLQVITGELCAVFLVMTRDFDQITTPSIISVLYRLDRTSLGLSDGALCTAVLCRLLFAYQQPSSEVVGHRTLQDVTMLLSDRNFIAVAI